MAASMSYLLVSLCCLTLFFSVEGSVICGQTPSVDVDRMIRALERTITLLKENKSSLTADVILGLIFGKNFLLAIPSQKRNSSLYNLMNDCDELIQGYQLGEFGDHSMSQELIPYMINDSLWENIVQPLRTLPKTDSEYPTIGYSMHYTQIEADLSDFCFLLLFRNNCDLPTICLPNKLPATPYVQTHLLLLLITSNALGCEKANQHSEYSTKYTKGRLCQLMNIDSNILLKKIQDVGDQDLFLERLVLCGLEGYAEFLRKDWLDEIFKWEKNGCFGMVLFNQNRKKKNDSLFGANCHSHPTGLGFAALAFFVRGVIELCV